MKYKEYIEMRKDPWVATLAVNFQTIDDASIASIRPF